MSRELADMMRAIDRIAPGHAGDVSDIAAAIDALIVARIRNERTPKPVRACTGCLGPLVDGLCPKCDF